VRRASAFLDVNGTRHPLHDGGIVVGRGTDADLRINDPGVSRRHVEFTTWQDGPNIRVAVTDLGSTNGMLVNGHKVAQASLDDGGTVKIGNTTMTIRYVTSGHGDPGQGGPGV
jgi:pSer/pThr/pTyr-binding forkhead associated (FHA) protein